MSASVFLLRFSTDSIVVFIIQSAIFKHNNLLLVRLLMSVFFFVKTRLRVLTFSNCNRTETLTLKSHYPLSNSSNWSLYISIKNKLREFDKISKQFPQVIILLILTTFSLVCVLILCTTLGARSFPAAAPKLWNELPVELR